MSVLDRVTDRRLGRLVSFVSVGGVGMLIDLTITFTLLSHLPVLAANAAGWIVAVSHNFLGNWWVTFGRPDGHRGRQYLGYVSAHAVTFGARAVVVASVLAATAVPATLATLAGVGVAACINFVAAERIFAGLDDVWHRVVTLVNRLAHRLWHTQLREILLSTGTYSAVFAVFAWGLTAATPGSTQSIRVGGVETTLQTASPTETVSVLHTVENERDVLAAFVADVRPADHVLDVGSNVGVFAALASAAGARVTAVEPHGPTAAQCRHNVPEATVHDCALGAGVGTVRLAVHNDAVGTQRAHVGDGTHVVEQLPGDRLATPTVLKVDVEGAEAAVLMGLDRALSRARVRVIYVETHGGGSEVRALLAAHGYEITDQYRVGADERVLRATRVSG